MTAKRFCCDGQCDKGASCPAFAGDVLGEDLPKPPSTLRPLVLMLVACAAAIVLIVWSVAT